jgi:hypothetical protein
MAGRADGTLRAAAWVLAMRTMLVAFALCLGSYSAWADCNTVDAMVAQIDLKTENLRQTTAARLGHPPSDTEINDSFKRFDQRVSAAVSHCRRGDLITIPTMYIKRFCDFGKNIVREGETTNCVKR